ncbi:MAG: protein-L-isoaspartate(D-aspartate) O-methyltransferase [Terriglobia bacterium]
MIVTQQFDMQARHMVETQLRPRGIRDERVLEAMLLVPRHEFVPAASMDAAYDDRPLPIGEHETISQPYIVAAMTQAARVEPGDNALEIGGGSGYQAAILAHLGAAVCTIEINPRLAQETRKRLERLGYTNVEVLAGDGSEGYAARAPYNVVIVSAATPSVSPVLLSQLAEGGRLVAPVGNLRYQELLLLCRRGGQITTQHLDPCQFVPLFGKGGWPEEQGGRS